MTKQETFDTVVAHLRKQGTQATNGRGTCLYRAPNGMKCAAGCLIPDDKYNPEFEYRPVDVLYRSPVTPVIRELGHDVDLVAALQRVHDGNRPERWESLFKIVAAHHKLVYSPVEGGNA